MAERKTARESAILLVIKGVLIGIANVIPGVSGGTFALILGIYDRLIDALRGIGVETVKATLGLVVAPHRPEARERFAEALRRMDFWFLLPLGVGALIAIAGSSFLIDWLLTHLPGPTLAFFLGLIIPSIAVPWRMMPRRSIPILLWAIPGAALTVGVSVAFSSNAAGSHNPLIVMASGAAAISAMILPGISGSFLMLVIGQYQNVLQAIQGVQVGLAQGRIDWGSVTYLLSLALGIVVGLLAFARLLGWVLERYRSATLAFLIGLVVGSFYVLWPFKDFDAGAQVTDRHGEEKTEVRIATAPNRLPRSAGEAGGCALGLVIGLVGAVGVERLGRRREEDEPEPEEPAPSEGDG